MNTSVHQLGRRERGRKEMQERIVRAAIELHQSLGPARTTIADIARQARVQRLTVYRYFPDERSLRTACSTAYRIQKLGAILLIPWIGCATRSATCCPIFGGRKPCSLACYGMPR